MLIRNRIAALGLAGVVALSTPLVSYSEGLRLRTYLDPVGIPTYCYGETQGAQLGKEYTKQECDTLMEAKLTLIAWQVDQAVTPPLPPETHAALTSFTYNVGLGAFKSSTLFQKLQAGDIAGACNQLPRWIYAKGKMLPGLPKRREAERKLCLKGINHES